MKIVIYIEGGGETHSQKATLRLGFEALLKDIKDRARARRLGPRFVLCGSRDEACEAFKYACEHETDTTNFLLVDADESVDEDGPTAHLKSQTKWDLEFAGRDKIHLMVQIMETWLLADQEALAKYYGQHFSGSALPTTLDLETVPKSTVESSLNKATAKTTKGQYHKIRHASDLLARVSPQKVRERCKHCDRLFESVLQTINSA